MQLIISRKELTTALDAVSRVISKNGICPILNNVLLEGRPGHLEVKGTDIAQFARVDVPCECSTSGAVTVNCRTLKSLLKTIPTDAQIVIKSDSDTLSVDGTLLDILPAEEYPVFPSASGEQWRIDANVLRQGLMDTMFAMSKEDFTNSILHGSLFSFATPNKLRIVATDRMSLAIGNYIATPYNSHTKDVSCVLRFDAVNNLLRLIPKSGYVEFIVSDVQAQVKIADTTLVFRIVAGQYPNYERVIPTDSRGTITVCRSDLLSQLKQELSVVKKAAVSFKLHGIIGGEKQLHFAVDNRTGGPNWHILPCKHTGEAATEFAFMSTRLLPILEVSNSDMVTLSYTGAPHAFVVSFDDKPENTYLVMPWKTWLCPVE